MGVAKLKKVELYYHKSVGDEVAKALQCSGICQIIESVEDARGPRPEGIDESLRGCEEQQTHIRYLFRVLEGFYKDPVSAMDRMLGEKPSLSLLELTQTARQTDLGKLASSVKNAETELNELRIEASQLNANAAVLSKIKDMPYTLDVLSDGTRTLKGVLGTLKAADADSLTEGLKSYESETDIFVVKAGPKEKETWAMVLYAKTREEEVLALCAQNGMTLVDLPAKMTGSASEELAKTTALIAESKRKESEILKTLSRMAERWMPDIQKMSDYWKIMHDRYLAVASSDATSSTVKTTFWVPADAMAGLQKHVESVAPGVAFIASDPEEGDRPPTILRNNKFNSPSEVLTNLYSPPVYGRRDPTPPMAPFFLLFFGMCLGDAGYALVIGVALLELFKKYRRIPFGTKNFMNLFFQGAVATFLYGAFTGSFFGDLIDVFPGLFFMRPIKDALLIVDPMKTPMTVLGLALFLGVIHLMFGLCVAAYDECRQGHIADAVGGKISWFLLVVGLIFFGAGVAEALPSTLGEIGKWTAVVGACLVFWYAGKDEKNIFLKVGVGLYALYGSTAYLGDILSYSRLLALGLGSAVIGAVINMLGGLVSGIPFVGWLLAALVVVGGHIFSLAINLLGSFVHAMRLQYVEFFGKFYGGDGVSFKPLTLQTQYVEILEEVSF